MLCAPEVVVVAVGCGLVPIFLRMGATTCVTFSSWRLFPIEQNKMVNFRTQSEVYSSKSIEFPPVTAHHSVYIVLVRELEGWSQCTGDLIILASMFMAYVDPIERV